MRINYKMTVTLVLSISLNCFLPGTARAAYDASWGLFLKKYVRDGRVNYSAVKADPVLFNQSVDGIENVQSQEYDSWPSDARKAFWINAYNIGAMKLVLDHYPLKRTFGIQALRYPAQSIQQIPDVWNQPALTIFGRSVSLNSLENDILRKEFNDPRVHFAIVCASLGCPVLRGEAYVLERLDAQLTDQVRRFVSDPKKVRYDARSNTLGVSPIFKWFKEDFDKAGGAVPFIRKFMPAAVKISDNVRLQWLEYDWSLNEQ